MEIEVNDYVRLKNGEIDKVFALCGMIENTIHLENHKWMGKDYISKYSNNIIELIEVGDILRVFDNLSETEEKVNVFDDEMLKAVKKDIKDNNYKILSILTHEQFSSLEYII